MAIANANTPSPCSSTTINLLHPEYYEEEQKLPEMSDVEKDVIIEWISLGENPEYTNQPSHGINLFELIKILEQKWEEMSSRMPNTSIENRMKAFNWTPYPSPVTGTINIFNNPLCTLLMFRVMMEISKSDPTLEDMSDHLKNKMIQQYSIIKAHYFNITD